jgi:AraC-like DNA-binding protein
VVALPDVNENSSKDSVSSGVPTELQAITTSMLQEQTAEGDEEPGKIKYQKSALGEEEARQIHLQLQLLMKTEKPYQDPDLTLTNLSQKIGVHPNILSQVINSFEKKNFYEYINEYRIENFKQLIRSPENNTLLSLAFECGFNSKTAFNRNFKKATGLSPSDYMTQQQAQTSDNS